jgi:hypothetical protein
MSTNTDTGTPTPVADYLEERLRMEEPIPPGVYEVERPVVAHGLRNVDLSHVSIIGGDFYPLDFRDCENCVVGTVAGTGWGAPTARIRGEINRLR